MPKDFLSVWNWPFWCVLPGEVAEWFPVRRILREGTPSGITHGREEGASLERDGKVYFAYVLLSLKDGTHYYGSTSNLEKRVREHNSGKARFTKGHRPFTLLYSETFATKAEASKRERFFKSISGYTWLRHHGVIKQNEQLERWPSG